MNDKIEQEESNRFYYAILHGYQLLYGDEDYEKLMKALGESVIIKSSKYEESKKSTVDDIIEMYKRDKDMEEMKLEVIKYCFGDDNEKEEAAVKLENRRSRDFGYETNKFILDRGNI